MEFIPGDIVRYKGKTAEYLVIINAAGNVRIRHIAHGGEYILNRNAHMRMEQIRRDIAYIPTKENIRAFQRRHNADNCSQAMRAYIERALTTSDMDMSGFDALKSASNNDSIDALSYADYCKSDVRISDNMMSHGKSYHLGVDTMRDSFDVMGVGKGSMSGDSTADIMARLEQDRNKTSRNINKEDKMSITINGLVAKVTNSIEEAKLITQYFGAEYNENSYKDELFLKQNYKEVLKEAKAREEKRLANLNNA